LEALAGKNSQKGAAAREEKGRRGRGKGRGERISFLLSLGLRCFGDCRDGLPFLLFLALDKRALAPCQALALDVLVNVELDEEDEERETHKVSEKHPIALPNARLLADKNVEVPYSTLGETQHELHNLHRGDVAADPRVDAESGGSVIGIKDDVDEGIKAAWNPNVRVPSEDPRHAA